MAGEIEALRKEIAVIDEGLLVLHEKRLELGQKVEEQKFREGNGIVCPEVETEKLDQVAKRAKKIAPLLGPDGARAVIHLAMLQTTRVQTHQRDQRAAHQSPAGSDRQ